MPWVEITLDKILITKNMTRRELSRRTKIRHSTINELCNNTAKQIPLKNITLICDELEIEVGELFKFHKG
ncbi:helix-turn-helix domain-containing protein [Paenibacillus donghaensis]|uniref:HTH cro/C1-type domain-containing protein n=1 Tax=Paenibacillus donghaensis TaxID=414771 RepID=A0A2Z2KTF0_9BACL|nr:hypothetical protein B9T62_19015 [Paenibacillus donghaensis]